MLLDVLRRLKRLENLVPWTSGGGGGAFARGWAEHLANSVHSGVPTIIVSKTLTPTATGKFRIIVTGSAEGGGDGGPDQFTLSISNGAGATPAIYTSNAVFTSHDNSEAVGVCLVVDLDQLGAPVTYPLGTPVQFNAVAEYSGTNDPATVVLQMEIQEVP